jgi:hypothetical protein
MFFNYFQWWINTIKLFLIKIKKDDAFITKTNAVFTKFCIFFKKMNGCKTERLRKCWVTTTLGEELLLKSQDECDGNTFQRLQHKTSHFNTFQNNSCGNLSFMVTNLLYTFSNKCVTTMRKKNQHVHIQICKFTVLQTCRRLCYLCYNKFTYLHMHLLVLFHIMNHQCMAMNDLNM